MHLSDWQINSIVHYEDDNNEFYQISKKDYKAFSDHIKLCIPCSKKVEDSRNIYNDITGCSEITSFAKTRYFKIAILFLIFISYQTFNLFTNETNKHHIELSEFNFMITRNYNLQSIEEKNMWVYQLNEKKYDELISNVEKTNSKKDNLYYIAALVLKGQETNNLALIREAKTYIYADSLSNWKKRINLILSMESEN